MMRLSLRCFPTSYFLLIYQKANNMGFERNLTIIEMYLSAKETSAEYCQNMKSLDIRSNFIKLQKFLHKGKGLNYRMSAIK